MRVLAVVNATLGTQISAEQLTGAASLDDLVPISSLALVDLVISLEEEFGVTFGPQQMERSFFMNVPSLVKFIEESDGGG